MNITTYRSISTTLELKSTIRRIGIAKHILFPILRLCGVYASIHLLLIREILFYDPVGQAVDVLTTVVLQVLNLVQA